MLAAQRQARILGEIQRLGAVRVSQLTDLLGVSDMTIRRDLDVLAKQRLVDKVHGGATLPQGSSTEEPGFDAKWVLERDEKLAIAEAAAALVEPGMAVGVSAGTTTWTLAHQLRDIAELTVVTNSVKIADVLEGGSGRPTVVLTGGVRTPSDALVGPVAVAALRSLHLDIVFLGVHGVDPRGGFTTPNLLEADTDRALAEAGRRLVVVADHTKWGVVGISTIVALADADVLVTDSQMPPEAQSLLAQQIDDVIVAPVRAGAEEPA